MKKMILFSVLALLCLFSRASAQSGTLIRPLKTSDTVPDITLRNVINFKSGTIRLADYRDKLVIVDFWATFCGPCIEHMPELYALQQKYKDQVFILLDNNKTTRDSPEKVRAFFAARKAFFDLPSLAMDTVLLRLFHPPSLGVYAWIKNGVIRAFTEAQDVTEDNIQKLISGGNPDFHQLAESNFSFTRPLFINGNGGQAPPAYLYRSLLTPYIAGVSGIHVDQDTSGRISRIGYYGVSIRMLLIGAHPEYGKFQPARLKIRISNPDALADGFTTDSGKRKSLYNYEALFQSVSRAQAWAWFRQDIARYFPYTIDSARIRDSCWVLKLAGKPALKTSGPGERGTNYDEHSGLPVYFNSMPVSALIRALEHIYKEPFLDETGYTGKLWLRFPPDLGDSRALAISLARQGIILTKEPREIEYAVITDRELSN